MTAAGQRRLLGLPVPDEAPERDEAEPDGGIASGALATELTSRLGCAVLAMRYPVGDEFSMALTGKLYDLLARQGQPLPRAVGMTLRQLLAGADGARFPALSAAAPALFGGTAVNPRLAAPRRPPGRDYGTDSLKMAGLPAQPERFVGRTGVLGPFQRGFGGREPERRDPRHPQAQARTPADIRKDRSRTPDPPHRESHLHHRDHEVESPEMGTIPET